MTTLERYSEKGKVPADRVLEAVSQTTGREPRRSGAGWTALCPSHDDRNPSLSISKADDGKVLIHCHSGCTTSAVVEALGLKMADLMPPKDHHGIGHSRSNGKAHVVETYPYVDANGELIFEVVRKSNKQFLQRQPDGSGGWSWSTKGIQSRPVYHLPEVAKADPEAWVFMVEGERDADRLAGEGLTATCTSGGAGKWKHSDLSPLRGRRVAVLADNDNAGRAHAQSLADELHGKAASVRVVELPGLGDKQDVSDWLNAGHDAGELIELTEQAPEPEHEPVEDDPAGDADDGQPAIPLTTDEYHGVDLTIRALASHDPDLYRRSGALARVVRQDDVNDGVKRPDQTPTIRDLPDGALRSRMTRFATFARYDQREGEWKPAHPAPWLVQGVAHHGEWPGIRPLDAISNAPVLRPDGTVVTTPGYDAATRTLYEPSNGAETVNPPTNPTQADAKASADRLLDLLRDFPMAADEHRSAWLAGLLTPLARSAFDGPAPLHLADANVRGAGKGLLLQVIGRIVSGQEMPVSGYADDGVEMGKRITAIALAGDPLVMLDNLDGDFGNDALDRALTCTRWSDRILGKSERVDLPLLSTFYATGNNVQVKADTARRIIHIRLDVMTEKPEHRSGFTYPNLIEHVTQHRPALLADALTVLSAYIRAGKPGQRLKAFGSFEGWSEVVRSAITWVGLPDPVATQETLGAADAVGDSLGQLLAAWQRFAPHGEEYTVGELIQAIYPSQQEYQSPSGPSMELRSAIEAITGALPGKPPSTRRLGNTLRGFRHRVVNGAYLDTTIKSKQGQRWTVKGDSVTLETLIPTTLRKDVREDNDCEIDKLTDIVGVVPNTVARVTESPQGQPFDKEANDEKIRRASRGETP